VSYGSVMTMRAQGAKAVLERVLKHRSSLDVVNEPYWRKKKRTGQVAQVSR
jgi:hypothetical protein